MDLKELEKIETSVVVVPGKEVSVSISGPEIAAVIRDPDARVIGQPPLAIEVTSMRDQILVRMAEGKIMFMDQSDTMPGSTRLPKIVYGFLDILAKQDLDTFSAYGINFKVAFDARGDRTASEIVAERFINRDELKRHDLDVKGAGIRLYFDHATGARCRLRVEPQGDDRTAPRFRAEINYHYELPDGKLPPIDQFKTSFHGLWPQYIELLDRLLN